MLNNILLVGLGGGIGSILRYLFQRAWNINFPYGTLLVNIGGCLLIGLLAGIFIKQTDESRRLLLLTGFCGGFTTFSSFTYEGMQMMTQHRWLSFALYTGVSVSFLSSSLHAETATTRKKLKPNIFFHCCKSKTNQSIVFVD